MKSLIFLSLFLLCNNIFSQKIKEVHYWQTDGKFKLTYDLIGIPFYKVVNIKLVISTDGGKTFSDTLQNITGDVGNNITEGKFKTIICDIPRGLEGKNKNVILDVKADIINLKLKKYFYIAYSFSNHAPIGFQAGIIGGRFGGYLDLKISKAIFQKSDYDTSYFTSDRYTRTGNFYRFTGIKERSRFSGTIGINYQIVKNLYLMAGFGYGIDNELWRIIKYDKNYLVQDINWAKYTTYSIDGYLLETSLQYNVRSFLFSAGISEINFKAIYYNLGFGYVFKRKNDEKLN